MKDDLTTTIHIHGEKIIVYSSDSEIYVIYNGSCTWINEADTPNISNAIANNLGLTELHEKHLKNWLEATYVLCR